MRSRAFFVLFVGIFLMSACTGKRELVTYWRADLKPEEAKFSGADFESKLRWTVSNDDDFLYFDIGCYDPEMQQSLVRGGLTVFIDTSARKREFVFFKFPNVRISRQSGNSRQRSNPFDQGITPQIVKTLDMSPVYWQDGDKWSLEDPMSDSSSFKSGITMDSTNMLILQVAVPLEAIHPNGLDGLGRISIGFLMQGPRRTQGMANQQQIGGGGRSSGGGRGGGGRGGGGRSGGSMGGGMSQGMGSGGGAPIAFWYLTSLAKEN